MILSDRQTETSYQVTWDMVSGQFLDREEIPYCEHFDCQIEEEVYFLPPRWDRTQPLSSMSGHLELSFDDITRTFTITDTDQAIVLESWLEGTVPGDDFWWSGERLYPHSRMTPELPVFCTWYWERESSFVGSASPTICGFSPSQNDMLRFPTIPTEKASLIDLATGATTRINFFARDGAFSPDGQWIALGNHDRVTIWQVEALSDQDREYPSRVP
jgi:hypothetical protein